MIARVRWVLLTILIVGLAGTVLLFAQEPAAPQANKAGATPAGQAPAAKPPSQQSQPFRRGPNMGLGKSASAAEVAKGKAIFESNCSFCHGADARGNIGPDLLLAAPVLDDVDGNKIGPIVKSGFPPRMPSFNFTQEQITELAAFLHNRVLAVANLAHGQYKLPFTVSGNAAAGKAYFFGPGKCSTCHSVTSGPLADIGSKYTPLEIQNGFLRGSLAKPQFGRGKAPARQVTVTLPSGKTLTGNLKYIDEFNVIFVDAAGNVHSLPITKGMKVVVAPPANAAHQKLLDQYTDADIHNLTAYLVTLK